MGKLLSLGPQLPYPITVSKLLKRSGDEIKKQDALFEYSFKWMKMVGDPFGEEVEMEQTTYGTWDSPAEGNIQSWKIKEGQRIDKDMMFVEIEEACPHSIQFAGLCGMCGKDMNEMSWASSSKDTERAKINMIHDQNKLMVSQDEASKAEEELQRRLLKHRKLSLVVDLDQTIIHACIEPTVGEWQRDPTSPNYEAVKDVKSFQLNDDALRGMASGCSYYIKMRPGLKEFLAKISEMYELHVYTMGTRAYAVNIAKLVDPDKKFFGDRIISRDENGSMTAKSLARLFPVDTKMVVIIDDRADVWPKNRPNLIKVHPYDFFLGIGDINSSFLPKREELPKIKINLKKKEKTGSEESAASEVVETSGDASTSKATKASDAARSKDEAKTEDESKKISALEELVRMGGGDDQALREEQTAEQEKFLEKQLKERPLLHMQEKLDQEEEAEEDSEEKNGETTTEHHHRHNLLKDDDVELMYLEQHLSQVHKAFYDQYDSALHNAQGGRLAQLRPGHNKKVSIKDDAAADLKIVPDIGQVMPNLKSRVFQGTTIVLSGLVPLNAEIMRSEIALQAQSFGAELQTKISRKVTHLVTPTSRTRTQKVRQAARYPHIKVVHLQWLLDSMSKWKRQDEDRYLVDLPDRVEPKGPNSVSSIDQALEDTMSDDEETGGSDSEHENESIPASQEETEDEEGVMPSDIDGQSPIDDLKTFDWGSADSELAEFMNSDSENDSDTSSVSTSSKHSVTKGGKRPREDATDDDDSDDGSTLVKKQKIANSRKTGLKTVKTPNSAESESSLPTPGVTGDEDGGDAEDVTLNDDGDEDEFKDLEDDLEAELEAELAGG